MEAKFTYLMRVVGDKIRNLVYHLLGLKRKRRGGEGRGGDRGIGHVELLPP